MSPNNVSPANAGFLNKHPPAKPVVFHVRAKPYNTSGALEGAQTICQLLIHKRSFSVFLSALGFTEPHAYRGVLEDTQEGLPSREPFLVQNRIYMQYNPII